jgi:hypothetical protein
MRSPSFIFRITGVPGDTQSIADRNDFWVRSSQGDIQRVERAPSRIFRPQATNMSRQHRVRTAEEDTQYEFLWEAMHEDNRLL